MALDQNFVVITDFRYLGRSPDDTAGYNSACDKRGYVLQLNILYYYAALVALLYIANLSTSECSELVHEHRAYLTLAVVEFFLHIRLS